MGYTAHRDSGVAMLPALFLVLITMGILFSMTMTSFATNRQAHHQQLVLQARYLGEGGMEFAKKAIQDALSASSTPPSSGTAKIDGIDVHYEIKLAGSPTVQSDPSGFQVTIQPYEISTSVMQGRVRGRVHRIVNALSWPMFQYLVFFDQSLDILPAPDMVLTGRIHTNGDLRLGCNGTLTIDTNYVRAVGDVRRWRKNNNKAAVGNVKVRRWVANPLDPTEPAVYEDMESLSQMTSLGVPSTSGYDSLFPGYDINGNGSYEDPGDWKPFSAGVLERYGQPAGYAETGNTLKMGVHGVTRATPPPVGSLAMFVPKTGGDYIYDSGAGEYVQMPPGTGTHTRGYFHEHAGLSILVSDDGLTWKALDDSGIDVTALVSSAVSIELTYDERQGGDVRVAKVDVDKLNSSGAFPSNGLLYVSHYGMGTGTDSKGVHLHNGQKINADLTVVTEGSAYLQGDYNTDTPVSAAVLSDAINLLSNSWANGPAMPKASNTTYNVAMVGGNQETVSGNYNGGLENFPRFHENWSGVTCKIVGAMISIWDNKYATGPWGKARYSPPNRNYGFDNRFNNVSQLPPFTPMVVSVEDLVRW